MDSFKIYALNTGTFVISLTNLENTLKVILLIISIAYTCLKTLELIKSKKNENK